MQLNDCRAILTGASGGIGVALTKSLCAAGAQVLAVSRHSETLADLQAQYPQQLRWIAADLRERPARDAVVEATKLMGGANLLINAAGVNCLALLEQTSEAQIDEMLLLNVNATLQLTRALLPDLRKQPRALVMIIGSTYGSIGYPGYVVYSACKFALRGFSEALRRELADSAVRVLYIAPRATRTPMNGPAATALNSALKTQVDSPTVVASAVLAAIQRERAEVYLGWPEKLFVRINNMWPRLVDRSLRKQLATIHTFCHTSHIAELAP